MPSTPTERLRLILQATGENLDVWGSTLNSAVFTLLDQAVAGVESVAVAGDVSLTSQNYVEDQSRNAVLIFTGTGGTVTVPSSEKVYIIRNDCTGNVTLTAGGSDLVLAAGLMRIAVCDGSNVFAIDISNMGGERMRNVAAPITDTDATTKGAVDSLLSANATASTAYTDQAVSDIQAGVLTPAQASALAMVNTLITDSVGTDGQVFTSGGPDTDPVWQDLPAPVKINTRANRWRFR